MRDDHPGDRIAQFNQPNPSPPEQHSPAGERQGLGGHCHSDPVTFWYRAGRYKGEMIGGKFKKMGKHRGAFLKSSEDYDFRSREEGITIP